MISRLLISLRSILLLLLMISKAKMDAIEIVSLGDACNIARAARHNNVRNIAYPFDWLITPFEALLCAFKDDFKNILIPEQTFARSDNKAVIDGYGLMFIHDFPTVRNPIAPVDGEIMPVTGLAHNWRDSIAIVKAKFFRRLERLLKFLHDGDPIALVRYNEISRDQAIEFVGVLKERFPKAKVIFVAIGYTDEFKQSWNLPNICNFYIEREEFAEWNGQAWSKIINKISNLKAYAWDDMENYPKTNVLTLPIYNPGMFCVFNTVLGALEQYDKKAITGLEVNFEDKGWYYDKRRGLNWWTYYFEPIELGASNINKQQNHFPNYEKIKFAYESQFEMSRKRAHELIIKYVKIRAPILKKIDEFYNQHLAGHYVIGLHYRGTDKLGYASPLSFDEIALKIECIVSAQNGESIKLFVATDDAAFVSYIKERFPDLVVMRDALRSNGATGIHTNVDLDPFIKGEDAIIDCILLSRSSLLLKSASNLSDCSLQFNPNLPFILLNESYSL